MQYNRGNEKDLAECKWCPKALQESLSCIGKTIKDDCNRGREAK